MIAGPQYAPMGYRSTRISGLLPVNIDRVTPDGKDEQFAEGFRPGADRSGPGVADLPIPGRTGRRLPMAHRGLAGEPPSRCSGIAGGVTVQVTTAGQKPAQVLAVHPSAKAPDGKRRRPAAGAGAGRGRDRAVFGHRRFLALAIRGQPVGLRQLLGRAVARLGARPMAGCTPEPPVPVHCPARQPGKFDTKSGQRLASEAAKQRPHRTPPFRRPCS